MRDFVYVDDVVAVNLWFFDHPEAHGLFNLGSGRAQPFNDVALAVINSHRLALGETKLTLADAISGGLIDYVDFPEALRGKYQCYTQADLSALRRAGCEHPFVDVSTGVGRYIQALSGRA